MTATTLEAPAFLAAWRHLDLGAMPLVLHVPGPAAPWADLVANGLAGATALDPWLADACALLAAPPRSVDLRLGYGSAAVRALAAPSGPGALRAVLAHHAVTLAELPSPDLPAALVDLIPAHAGGRIGAPDLSGRIGAAALDADGRRRRAADVVDFHGPVHADVLLARATALLGGLA
ncbi:MULTISPECIES: ESX secretion-associated protein EspG [Actinosynnema]|uniref:ESX secretion-associated protein EspG n=1 Tax=Actinosynnema TaxID=40566 RepID=UPI0031D1059C